MHTSPSRNKSTKLYSTSHTPSPIQEKTMRLWRCQTWSHSARRMNYLRWVSSSPTSKICAVPSWSTHQIWTRSECRSKLYYPRVIVTAKMSNIQLPHSWQHFPNMKVIINMLARGCRARRRRQWGSRATSTNRWMSILSWGTGENIPLRKRSYLSEWRRSSIKETAQSERRDSTIFNSASDKYNKYRPTWLTPLPPPSNTNPQPHPHRPIRRKVTPLE